MPRQTTIAKASRQALTESDDRFDEHFFSALGQLRVLETLAESKWTGDTPHPAEAEFWGGVTGMLREVLTKIEAMNDRHTVVSNNLYALTKS